MADEQPKRGYMATVLECRCPRCREGYLFRHTLSIRVKKNMEMNEYCPVCGQRTQIEVGFYYGTGYVSYLLALVITGIYFVLWFLLIGFSFSDNRFAFWIFSNAFFLILLQPWLMRLSRSLWISWFVHYDPEWPHRKPDDPERIVEEQMNNW